MITERPETRARNVAFIGLGFEIVLTAFFAIMAIWTASQALLALAYMAACGVTIWLYLTLVYHQRVLVQTENLETEQLRRERETGLVSGSVFEVDSEQLLLARRRLRWMYRWLLPIFTLAIIGMLTVAGLWRFSWGLSEALTVSTWPEIQVANATLAIWFVGGAAFLSFLLSRYATGMARQQEWRMLRSGASWLMGLTLGAVAVSVTLAPLHYSQTILPERVLAYVLRLLLLVLAGEIAFNFVLDFYRPRSPDEEPRPAFDSRLLGLFSEPGGLARSIADAINYQFGFEVSSTWFYKLVERAALPLVSFAVLALFGASCFVIIDADEEAVLERFGRPLLHADAATGEMVPMILQPGLHFKLPWPIDIAFKVGTKRIHQFHLGNLPENPESTKDQLILWTNKHEQEPHLKVLIATPQLSQFMSSGTTSRPAASQTSGVATQPVHRVGETPAFAESGRAVSVSILRIALVMNYRINSALDWISGYTEPEAMLRAIASHELTHYAASVEVEELLGRGRERIEADLWKRIEASADRAGLGVKIEFLGLQGVHPPEDTAQAFQDVIGAEQKKVATIRSARAQYNKRLSEVAGDVERAELLAPAIERMNRLNADPQASTAQREEAQRAVAEWIFGNADAGITPIGGQAVGLLISARAKRWEIENAAHAQATTFEATRVIKDAAPRVYYLRQKLQALADGLKTVRKYIMAAEGQVDVDALNLNLQEPTNAPIDYSTEEQK